MIVVIPVFFGAPVLAALAVVGLSGLLLRQLHFSQRVGGVFHLLALVALWAAFKLAVEPHLSPSDELGVGLMMLQVFIWVSVDALVLIVKGSRP